MFDPFDLDVDVTPDTIRATISEGSHTRAVLMALNLNEQDLIREAVEAPSLHNIQILARALPNTYLQRLMHFLAGELMTSPHLEHYMTWIISILTAHGKYIQSQTNSFLRTLRELHKAIIHQRKVLDN